MDLGLVGKRALVIGASRGLGRACAARLAQEGCRLALHGRDREALAQAAGATRAVATFPIDLADPTIATLPRRAAGALGGLDVMVVNAGHVPYGGLAQLDDAEWLAAFNMLLMSAVRLIRAAIPIMQAGGGGSIVVIGSATVREPGPVLLSNVMRAGVAGLVKTVSREVAGQGVRINVANPGYILSGRVAARHAEMLAEEIAPAEATQRLVGSDVPLGRLGAPDDLAAIVAFLASERAGFVTGATWAADGGAGRSVF